MTANKLKGSRAQALLDMLASYREWRAAQQAYAQALETRDADTITAADKALEKAYEKYKPHQEATQ